jgi:hypothetical protein
MAVESEPAGKHFATAGVDPRLIPPGIIIPIGPSWYRLIRWLLELAEGLPASAIPEVVDLYSAWSLGLFGNDPLTPFLLPWLHYWLTQIETAPEGVSLEDRRRPFDGELASEKIGKLAEDLRTGFLLFCNRTPKLAVEYLQSLRKRRRNNKTLRGILKFRGALAQAAPKELAELTAELLLPKEGQDDDNFAGPFREPFGRHYLDFVPASPAQGPFLELLLHAREEGLVLIRQLVDHAISFKSGGRDFGTNVIRITSSDGSELVFPWYQSYDSSRDLGSSGPVVSSALMALEAWAHSRIEAGEPVDKVLADVIGPANAPAAYLLVVVDLLLSHWPKSRIAAIPFLACPELLCLDRQRASADSIEIPDILGIKDLQKEPVGLASLDSLKSRPSRRYALDELLARYALEEYQENRDALAELLRRAASRLGPPREQSDSRDPEFMVVHALNLIEPKNWRKKTLQEEDGPMEAWEYVPPATEREHLKPLQEALREPQANASVEVQIRIALNNPGQPPEFVAAVIGWAQKVAQKPSDGEAEQWMPEEAIVSAAMIAARDGGADLVATHAAWIRNTFCSALKSKNDPVHRMRSGLQFNPIAIAFAGTALMLKNRFSIEDVRTVLKAAGDDNPAAGQGFPTVAAALAAIDERLPRAVLRCAFAACVQPHRLWGLSEDEYAARCEVHRGQVGAAIEAELAWLSGMRDEPEWPQFEPHPVRPRHRFTSRKGARERYEKKPRPDLYTDYQAAALWLGSAASIFDVAKRPWLRDIVKAYSDWTSVANGSELDEGDDADSTPSEWNYAYFNLLAHCLPGLTLEQVDELSVTPITGLPDQGFLKVMTVFLRGIDAVYFNDRALEDAHAAHIRSALAQRLMKTRDWEWQRRDRSKSILMRLGPAIAALLFNDYGHFQPPKCYLDAMGIDRLDPFYPLLKEVAESGPFLFVAIGLLNLLEVAPRPAHLPLISAAGKSWLTSNPDDRAFWIDHNVGPRLCSVIEALLAVDPNLFGIDQPLRNDIDSLLASLVRLGVPEAHRLEQALRLQ